MEVTRITSEDRIETGAFSDKPLLDSQWHRILSLKYGGGSVWLNEMYLKDQLLDVQFLGRGFAWLDTGTMQSLLQAAEFVEMIQSRQGITISAPEEIAYINRFIDKDKLMESAKAYGKSPYGEHLKAVAEGRVKY